MMRHKIVNLIILIILFYCACQYDNRKNINYESMEYIALNASNEIQLINVNGKIQYKIQLPCSVAYDFYLNNKYIYFYGEDKKLHVFDWKKNREKIVPQGPFVFKNKNYGPEIYHEIAVSEDGNDIVFVITPEYWDLRKEEPRDIKGYYEYSDIMDISQIGRIDLKHKKFYQIPLDKGEYYNTTIYKRFVFIENGGIVKYDLENNKKNYLYGILSEAKKKTGRLYNALILGRYFAKLIYAFVDYKYLYNDYKIYGINCWNIENGTNEILYDLSEFDNSEHIIKITDPRSRISKDMKTLAWIEHDDTIVLYDLATKKKENIFWSKNNIINRIQFFYDCKKVLMKEKE